MATQVKAGQIGTLPFVRATKSAVQSVPNGTWTIITWDTETNDTDTMHDLVTNNSRITINTPGVYIITVNHDWASSSVGERDTSFAINGVREAEVLTVTTPGVRAQTNLTIVRKFAKNDYIEVQAYQSSGGSLNFDNAFSGEILAQFSAAFLGQG